MRQPAAEARDWGEQLGGVLRMHAASSKESRSAWRSNAMLVGFLMLFALWFYINHFAIPLPAPPGHNPKEVAQLAGARLQQLAQLPQPSPF